MKNNNKKRKTRNNINSNSRIKKNNKWKKVGKRTRERIRENDEYENINKLIKIINIFNIGKMIG